MAVTLNSANLVVKDKSGNTGVVKMLSDADITKIKTAISDVAVVVDPATHAPVGATTTVTGAVKFADADALTAGTAGVAVDAAALKSAVDTSAAGLVSLATEQTITAKKTFKVLPSSSAVPAEADQLTNKAYVDGLAVDIAVADKYTEPAVRHGLLSPAANRVTAPSTTSAFASRGAVTGQLIAFCGTTLPDGYLLCNGALVSRTTYADLFAVIGATYGAGDGKTTFALPDYRDRVLQGASSSHAAGSYIAAGLPNIIGQLNSPDYVYGCDKLENPTPNGCMQPATTTDKGGTFAAPYTTVRAGNVDFRASLSNALYGASKTVQMSASAVQYLIKY